MNQKQTGGWLVSRSPGRSLSRTKKNSPNSKDRNKLQNQSQSQNGGRRRKSTMRKLRRGRKSRKVMRGGGDWKNGFDNQQLSEAFVKYAKQPDGVWLRNKWVIPELEKLTEYKKGDTTFWESDDALKEALNADPELNSKINQDNGNFSVKRSLASKLKGSGFHKDD
jgi:hypothetical protein